MLGQIVLLPVPDGIMDVAKPAAEAVSSALAEAGVCESGGGDGAILAVSVQIADRWGCSR